MVSWSVRFAGPLLAAVLPRGSEACTTLAAGRLATADGSTMLSHSDDGEFGADARLCHVPAADHPPSSQRPIYWDTEDYPRHVGSDRGSCYVPKPGEAVSKPIGFIPQVDHTYSYFEATYGIMNEHGLAIGESTCSGVFGTNAVGHGGQALLSVDELTKIAMERAKTAREAVEVMGLLAEVHGFYGAGSFEGSAESLMVGDATEVFIFHILPDPTGRSAIWAAQRVPDEHVAVVANMFVIREIDFSDTATFLCSQSVQSIAQEKGWWSPGQPFDFTKIYSDGEYASKFYSGRRMWGAFLKFGVSLPDDYSDLRYHAVYPVTAKPAQPVKANDFFGIHRYHYEGTKYDMTKGLAAGPWADPDRWATSSKAVAGSWERSIGIYRTTQTHVVQARATGQGSIMWYAPHATAGSCFVPITARATAVPAPYAVADPNVLDPESAYWTHRSVFNVAKIKYSYAMRDVQALQAELELAGAAVVGALDASNLTQPALDAALAGHANLVVQSFRKLVPRLLQRYADGWLDDAAAGGYPDWWLDGVGFRDGPPPPPTQPTLALRQDASSQPVGDLEFPGACDVAARRCVSGCSTSGFAACAAGCAAPCSPASSEGIVV